MARNDDAAARRRAKRKGQDPDADDATGTPGAAGGPAPDAGGPAPDDSLTAAEAANEARQGITGAPVEVPGPGEVIVETDFDPPPGGEIVGGEVTPAGGGPRVFRFFKASWAELKRVRWPDRQQVAQGTAVTLGFVVIAGAYLGVADVIARQIVNLII